MRWRSGCLVLVACCLSGSLRAGTELQSIEYTPPEIDYDVIARLWGFVKRQTGAPKDLPAPRLVLDWHVPPFARMGFQYPTEQFPHNVMQISIAPRTIEQIGRAHV